MTKINVEINGINVTGRSGMSILECAQHSGVDIPHLCYEPDIRPLGVCRVCVVEMTETGNLVAACHTPIVEGLSILTESPKVLKSRKLTIELMLTAHTGMCVTDKNASQCQLHRLASEFEAGPPNFTVRQSRSYPVEEMNPYIGRDLSKCILCRRCVSVCKELVNQSFFNIAYRGFDSQIIVDCDEPLNKDECEECGLCIDYCPTGALYRPRTWKGDNKRKSKFIKKEKEAIIPDEGRQKLLVKLKNEQEKHGYVSKEFMLEIARKLKLTLSDVYGVTSFYSFISTEPLGRNIVRVCKGLPCYLKNGSMILEAIKKELGIAPGETTDDGRFSLQLANCIGACDVSPAMLINHDVHGRLDQDKIPYILEAYS